MLIRIPKVVRKVRNFILHASRHFLKGDLSGWFGRIRAQLRFSTFQDAVSLSRTPPSQWHFGIMTPPYTEYVAQLMREHLQKHGWQVDILTAHPIDFVHDWYVVISPKSFTRFPPEKKRILLLMDDSETLRDYGKKDYQLLSRSFAVLESSLLNIEYLAKKNITFPKVHYLPIEKSALGVFKDKWFTFMFDRFLVAQGFLPVSWVKQMELPIPSSHARIGLSLPETIERRKIFRTSVPDDHFVFDGIRRQPGWVGCGLSYLALAHHALKHGNKTLSVMEDDVVLPLDFAPKMEIVREFLDTRDGYWDVFSGVIAAIHPKTRVLAVDVYRDMIFITINRMTSMVFNIYSQRALETLAAWNPEYLDAETNQIDRFLEGQNDFRVVVALPFLVGHREEAHSTIWGTSNLLYSGMIRRSEQALLKKVKAYQLEPGNSI